MVCYKYWIRTGDGPFDAKYYLFKSFKVYWAYRWFEARDIDKRSSVTLVKKQWGMVIEKTNYESRY